jgi:hypothetical protein
LDSDKIIGGALPEGRELGLEEPGEVSFEDAGLLFAVGHRAFGLVKGLAFSAEFE